MIEVEKAMELFRHHDKVKFILTGLGEREYETVQFKEIVGLLEKQIPKEPIILLEDEDGFAYQFEHYLCPNCKNIFEQRPQRSNAPLYSPNYCQDCGQAMKWE